ncbi:hypothetical protein AAHH80_36225, partial [Burkholderia pseudomallei]
MLQTHLKIARNHHDELVELIGNKQLYLAIRMNILEQKILSPYFKDEMYPPHQSLLNIHKI